MNIKKFYEKHKNFSQRTLSEYFISPGIKSKFDLIKEYLGSKRKFKNGIDLGCSGDSFLFFLDNVINKAFLDIANLPLSQYRGSILYHPVTADLTHLPFRNQSFDLITALDVLEHIKNDEKAVSEMSRILKPGGIVVLTVPHRMKYYSKQDQIIGHYRRYELDQIYSLFKKYNLYEKRTFGVYGQFMRIADIQSFNPEKTEQNLLKLRTRYLKNPIFQKIWNMVVKISSKFMKIDAKYHSLKRIMNIGLILSKK